MFASTNIPQPLHPSFCITPYDFAGSSPHFSTLLLSGTGIFTVDSEADNPFLAMARYDVYVLNDRKKFEIGPYHSG